jgi:hypothetical protein
MRAISTARVDSEKAILVTLEEANGHVSLGVLLDRLRRKGIQNEPDIKAAIWRLIDQQKIEMTPKRELRSTSRPGAVTPNSFDKVPQR